ncbi:ThuA domain-containing protein [Prosthecobacter sp.]|uniref:ThuA domain-containing protein n=1 Tax=Prosthecobacter sp. TaxID=1965333 RepID=UPI002ABBD9D9|nr:ThuA domain-containing protein [Prosthecobacter sp.]MDZ4404293.1 ThuA domain-containing protein [Prosthecobacter sp.]
MNTPNTLHFLGVLLLLGLFHSNVIAADPGPVRVLVWDEQQPEQKQAYGDLFLGETIAAHLAKQPGFTVKNVNLETPDQGLDAATLDATDVIIWWGHKQHGRVSLAATERVVQRVMDGKLALIALHSAHFAQPFMRLMHERAKLDAPALVPEAERATAKLDLTAPLKRYMAKADSPLTPALEKIEGGYRLIPPVCVFPSWRADAAPSHVTTLLPSHPIAQGLPAKWDIPQTEMYSEPFHVPKPDEVVLEERWDKGEHFRSGSMWRVGKGRVFYFRPGHETYPVFKQAEPLRVMENATRWLAQP